jgi:hypothetical protein
MLHGFPLSTVFCRETQHLPGAGGYLEWSVVASHNTICHQEKSMRTLLRAFFVATFTLLALAAAFVALIVLLALQWRQASARQHVVSSYEMLR